MFRQIVLKAPHPLRELFVLWFVAFWLTCSLTVFHAHGALRP
jgi:hypothetical protein